MLKISDNWIVSKCNVRQIHITEDYHQKGRFYIIIEFMDGNTQHGELNQRLYNELMVRMEEE